MTEMSPQLNLSQETQPPRASVEASRWAAPWMRPPTKARWDARASSENRP